jgi:hypothetical protein
VIIEFDASLNGIGILYYVLGPTKEVLIGGCTVNITSLKLGSEAKFQNTAEFIGIILGIEGLHELGINAQSVHLRGDSITALTWASTVKFKGCLVGNAASVFIIQGIVREVKIGKVTHLSAEDNWRADYLSRGGSLEGLLQKDTTLQKPQQIQLQQQSDLINLCDPKNEIKDENEFLTFWNNTRRILQTRIQHC